MRCRRPFRRGPLQRAVPNVKAPDVMGSFNVKPVTAEAACGASHAATQSARSLAAGMARGFANSTHIGANRL